MTVWPELRQAVVKIIDISANAAKVIKFNQIGPRRLRAHRRRRLAQLPGRVEQ